MARRCQDLAAQETRRFSVRAQEDKGSQGTRKAGVQGPARRSKRLNPKLSEYSEQQYSIPAGNTLSNEAQLPVSQGRCRKRNRETQNSFDNTPASPTRKRPKTFTSIAVEGQTGYQASICSSKTTNNPIDHWRKTFTWPKTLFEPEIMNPMLARKKSTGSLRRKRSDLDSATSTTPKTTPSDQRSREEKSAPYRDARYEVILKQKGSFMAKHHLGIADASKTLCRALLEEEQDHPEDNIFSDDLFDRTCEKIQGKNEARVIRDIALLIVPSAEILATRGARHLDILAESVNEGWNNSISISKTRPQPDYSIGFAREAFTDEQLTKIDPMVGDIVTDISYFMATYYIYFPFLTCEVKCGAAALDIADRQNAHSMTLAVRAVVELFRLAKREKEVDREILAFSISHDHRTVRIYGHYPVIDGKDTKYYRHPIRTFDFTELDGKDKWTAYKFTKNVYDIWMPKHLARIRSIIDNLPSDLNFEVPALPDATGLSQGLEGSHFSQLTEPESLLEESAGQASVVNQDVTPSTSFTAPETSKRPKKNAQKRKA